VLTCTDQRVTHRGASQAGSAAAGNRDRRPRLYRDWQETYRLSAVKNTRKTHQRETGNRSAPAGRGTPGIVRRRLVKKKKSDGIHTWERPRGHVLRRTAEDE
jgi:hypothetical protein